MNPHTDRTRAPRSPAHHRHRFRGPLRAFGLALTVVLLAALIAPLAGSPRGARAAANQPAAPEQAAVQEDGTDGDGNVAETPIAEETPVAVETPVVAETPVAEETPDAALTGDPYTSAVYVVMRDCDSLQGEDFAQHDANCADAPAFAFDVYGVDVNGGGLQESFSGQNYYGGLAAGQYTIRAFTPRGYLSPSVFCAVDDVLNQTAGAYAEVVAVDGYYEFALAPSQAIRCHWFFVSADADQGYGALKLGFSLCPPVEAIPFPFDYATADISGLATVCSLYRDGSVTFDLTSMNTGQTVSSFTDPSNYALAHWGQVAAGKARLTTEIWAGYGAPRVFCVDSNDAANIFEVPVQEWKAGLEIPAGQTAVCDWFNIPAAAEAKVGSVTVAKHLCDDIFDNGVDPYNASRADLLAECDPYDGDEVAFDLTHAETGETETRYTGSGPGGSAYWESVPAGDVTIGGTAGAGDGEPVVYCAPTSPAALQLGDAAVRLKVTNLTIASTLDEGWSLACDWFTIPDPNATSVTAFAYVCPAGTVVQGGYQEYAQACTEAAEGISMKLDGDSTGNPGDYPTDAEGRVRWNGLDADHFFLSAELPAGYGEPVAFCGADEPSGANPPAATPDAAPFTHRVEFDVADGDAYVCAWFGIPSATAAGSGAVEIVASACPTGGEAYALAFDALTQLCGAGATDLTFDLAGAATGLTGATDGAGELGWSGLPSGRYTLTEQVPLGSGRPIVFCDVSPASVSDGPDYDLVAVADGSRIELDLEAGDLARCAWFDVPFERGALNVFTLVCPEDAAFDYYAATPAELDARCAPYEGDELAYDLLTAGTGRTQTATYNTVTQDTAFSPVPPGDAIVTQHALEGYGKPIVSCVDQTFAPLSSRVEGWSVGFGMPAGQAIVCTVANVPGQLAAGAPAALTIHRFVCPENDAVDYYAASSAINGYDCQAYGDADLAYDLNRQDGNAVETRDTGSGPYPGSALWDVVPGGPVEVTARARAGYGTPVVRCWVNVGPSEVEQPVTVAGSTAGFEMPAGKRLGCLWFDIPAANDPGTLTAFAYLCPDGDYDVTSEADIVAAGCEDHEGDDVSFGLFSHLTGESQTAASGSGPNGGARWATVSPGLTELKGYAPAGYGASAVFCRTGSPNQAPLPIEIVGENAGFTMPAGQKVTCSWYHLPSGDDGGADDDTGSLWIYTSFCAEDGGIDYETADREAFEDPDGPCAFYEGDKVGFDLSGQASGETETRFTDPTDGFGASWDEAPAGPVTVTGHAQEGYGTPRVFCGISHDTNFEDFPVEVQGRSTGFDVPAGKTVICSWFNIPAASGNDGVTADEKIPAAAGRAGGRSEDSPGA